MLIYFLFIRYIYTQKYLSKYPANDKQISLTLSLRNVQEISKKISPTIRIEPLSYTEE